MKPRLPRRVVPHGARINLNDHWDALEEAYLKREAMRSAVTARLLAQRAYLVTTGNIWTPGHETLPQHNATSPQLNETSPQKAFASDASLPSFVLHAEQKERLSKTLNALLRISKERKGC